MGSSAHPSRREGFIASTHRPTNFTAAASTVRPEDLAEVIPAGPDVDRHLTRLREYIVIGVTRLAIAYPGGDFEGFFRFWGNELRPTLSGPGH